MNMGSRISAAELYDDKDIIIQILRLKDKVNEYAGGIVESMDVVGNDLVIVWEDGTRQEIPLPSPTGISSIAGNVSGGNLTITIYMTDGSSHAFTAPLSGMASEAYVDAKDAQNVKLTGNQSISGAKTFTGSANVPNAPSDPLGASAVNEAYVNDPTEGVNNIAHKSVDNKFSANQTIRKNYPCLSLYETSITPNEYDNIFTYDGTLNGVENIRLMRMQLRHLTHSNSIYFGIFDDEGNSKDDLAIVYDKNSGKSYAIITSIRVASRADVSGTTCDQDIVTVGMLKNLGLI